ncbi:MAG: DUF3489 domain-containing protein [Paracoccaceae bacterium]
MAKKQPKSPIKKPTPKPTRTARKGTKGATLLAMLQKSEGASISEMMQATGWLSHSIRGFMAGSLKKQGKHVVSLVPEDGARRYRLGDTQ